MQSSLLVSEEQNNTSMEEVNDFESVFEKLKSHHEAGDPLDCHVAACLVAVSEKINAHKYYGEASEFLLKLGKLDAAEEMAARTVQAAPDCGGGCHAFGNIYRARGDEETAKRCFGYQLPEKIINKHFPLPDTQRTSLEEASDSGALKINAYPADSYDLPDPIRIESRKIPKLEQHNGTISSLAAFTAIIPGGRVWFDGLQLTVWDATDRVVTDLCRGNPEVINKVAVPEDAVHLPGRVCVLGNRNARNFYHWMNDVLPALDVLGASEIKLDSIDRFYINPLDLKFQKQTLAHFGIEVDRIHQISDNRHVHCDELLVPRYGSNSLGNKQSRWLADFMKREFLYRGSHSSQLPKPSRRIYISRADSGVRGISNETQLLEFLQPWGFEVLKAADLSVQEQARAFSEAEVVMGPHGAAFSNVLCCQPGSKLIEFVNTHFETCFWAAAGMCEMEYFALSHKPQPGIRMGEETLIQKTIRLREANFEVDLGEVEKILQAAGCKKTKINHPAFNDNRIA